MTDASTLAGGFDTPALDAAAAFRAALDAMARPGTIHATSGAFGPPPLSPAAAALLLTLCDGATPIFLGGAHDTQPIRDWITFHTGAPFAARGEAQFAVGTWETLAPLTDYSHGVPEYPDRSATLIVEMDALRETGATLRGPGIRDTAALSLPEAAAFRANRTLFPLGLDFYFTCGDRLAALPRTTEVA